MLLQVKLTALDGIESEWRALNEAGGGGLGRSGRLGDREGDEYYPSYSNWMSYGTSFIGTIVENLQVQIRDVHLRYEDDISFTGGTSTIFVSKFACIFWLLLPFKNICYLSTLWQISQQILHVSWADLEFQYNLVFCLFSQGFLRG